MDANKIINADLLDILFEGKNKDYGAYELRKHYNRRIIAAVTIMAIACFLFFLSGLLANDPLGYIKPVSITELNLKNLEQPTEKPESPRVKPLAVAEPKPAVRRFTPPIITKIVDPNDQPPTIDELIETQIGLMDQAGVKNAEFTAPPVEYSTSAIESLKKPGPDYDKPFTKVEKEARFPGGMEAWKRYLERNLNSNVVADDGAPAGNYTVKVQFIVDKDGRLSEVHAIEVPAACPSCGPEAVKAIKKGPKWEPATQNDRKVIYQAIQFVTFQVVE